MYSPLKTVFKYLQYYLTASNGRGHGVHSPFVFEFITEILNDTTRYGDYRQVEDLRKELLKNKAIIQVNDLGAGSVASKTDQRTIASIARNAAKPEKFGQLLYRMAKYYRPATILELGTSLGITVSYLAKANPGAKIVTLEGSKEIVTVARKNFQTLGLQHIEIIEGNFDDILSAAINRFPSIDFSFIDGNHRLQPTIRYFEMI